MSQFGCINRTTEWVGAGTVEKHAEWLATRVHRRGVGQAGLHRAVEARFKGGEGSDAHGDQATVPGTPVNLTSTVVVVAAAPAHA